MARVTQVHDGRTGEKKNPKNEKHGYLAGEEQSIGGGHAGMQPHSRRPLVRHTGNGAAVVELDTSVGAAYIKPAAADATNHS